MSNSIELFLDLVSGYSLIVPTLIFFPPSQSPARFLIFTNIFFVAKSANKKSEYCIYIILINRVGEALISKWVKWRWDQNPF